MTTYYWVGGTGNWSDSAHWSLSSGGSGGAGVPSSSDDTVIDVNSGGSAFTLTVNGEYSVNSVSINNQYCTFIIADDFTCNGTFTITNCALFKGVAGGGGSLYQNGVLSFNGGTYNLMYLDWYCFANVNIAGGTFQNTEGLNGIATGTVFIVNPITWNFSIANMYLNHITINANFTCTTSLGSGTLIYFYGNILSSSINNELSIGNINFSLTMVINSNRLTHYIENVNMKFGVFSINCDGAGTNTVNITGYSDEKKKIKCQMYSRFVVSHYNSGATIYFDIALDLDSRYYISATGTGWTGYLNQTIHFMKPVVVKNNFFQIENYANNGRIVNVYFDDTLSITKEVETNSCYLLTYQVSGQNVITNVYLKKNTTVDYFYTNGTGTGHAFNIYFTPSENITCNLNKDQTIGSDMKIDCGTDTTYNIDLYTKSITLNGGNFYLMGKGNWYLNGNYTHSAGNYRRRNAHILLNNDDLILNNSAVYQNDGYSRDFSDLSWVNGYSGFTFTGGFELCESPLTADKIIFSGSSGFVINYKPSTKEYYVYGMELNWQTPIIYPLYSSKNLNEGLNLIIERNNNDTLFIFNVDNVGLKSITIGPDENTRWGITTGIDIYVLSVNNNGQRLTGGDYQGQLHVGGGDAPLDYEIIDSRYWIDMGKYEDLWEVWD